MNTDEKIEFKLILVAEPDVTLRGLDSMRSELFDFLQKEISPETAMISQPSPSRSLDPAVIGAIGLAVLPSVAEKIGDLLIKWTELRKETVTLKLLVEGVEVIVSYDPKKETTESLKNKIETIQDALKPRKRKPS